MNMKTLKAVLFTIAVLLVPSFASAQVGTALTQTTLTATIGPGLQSFALGSVTGVSGFGPGINSPTGGTVTIGNITNIYIDRELMQVISVNTTAKTVFVIRGSGGTQASAHAATGMVLIGPASSFYNYDPEGFCGTLPSNQGSVLGNPPIVSPWINTRTGAQWLCSTITSTWTPGFSGPSGVAGSAVPTTLVASAAGVVLPSGALFHINGTQAITGFTIPVGCNATAVGGCQFTVIPDAVFTWTTATNIAVAGTAVVNKALTFIWDAVNSKWVPSYIA
jgi:hypothetical protein